MFGLSAKAKVPRIIQTDEQDLRCKVFIAKSVKSIPIFQHTRNRKIRPHYKKLQCSTKSARASSGTGGKARSLALDWLPLLPVLLASRSGPVRPRTGQEIM